MTKSSTYISTTAKAIVISRFCTTPYQHTLSPCSILTFTHPLPLPNPQTNQIPHPPQRNQKHHNPHTPPNHKRPPPPPPPTPPITHHAHHRLHHQSTQRPSNPYQAQHALAQAEGEEVGRAVGHFGSPAELEADEGAGEEEELDGFGWAADFGVRGPGGLGGGGSAGHDSSCRVVSRCDWGLERYGYVVRFSGALRLWYGLLLLGASWRNAV